MGGFFDLAADALRLKWPAYARAPHARRTFRTSHFTGECHGRCDPNRFDLAADAGSAWPPGLREGTAGRPGPLMRDLFWFFKRAVQERNWGPRPRRTAFCWHAECGRGICWNSLLRGQAAPHAGLWRAECLPHLGRRPDHGFLPGISGRLRIIQKLGIPQLKFFTVYYATDDESGAGMPQARDIRPRIVWQKRFGRAGRCCGI